MYSLDLISLLKAYKNKGIEKVEVYGKITRQLPKPTNLFDNISLSPTGIFVEMQVFAVNMGYHQSYLKQNGVWNKDNIYMVNGSICTFIEPAGKTLPEWYTVRGHLRFGTKDTNVNYLTMFNFGKDGENWVIYPCNIFDIDISGWDRDSEYYKYINKCWESNQVILPTDIQCLTKFSSTIGDTYNIPKTSLASMGNSNLNNVQIPTRVSIPKSAFNKECRQDIKQPNELYGKFKDTLDKAKTSRESFLNNIAFELGFNDNDYYLEYMLDGLSFNLKHKPSPYAMTGQAILKKYLEEFKGHSTKYIGNITAGDYLVSIFDEVKSYILDHNTVVNADGVAFELCKSAFGNKYRFYIGIVSIILGIPLADLESGLEVCNHYDLDIIRMLNENPYILQFVSPLRFAEIERIAVCYQKQKLTYLDTYRNIAMLNDFINDKDDGSTVFTRDYIINSNIGITLTKAKYEQVSSSGTYLSNSMRSNLNAYIKSFDNNYEIGYVANDFTRVNNFSYIKKLSTQDVIKAIKDYNESGLGVLLDNYLTSYTYLYKELFVFDTMTKLGSKKFNYDITLIDKYIDEYEGIVGFKLEDRQRQAVHLCCNAGFIVAGSAGSGKTTVSNCIVYVISKLEPKLNIEFAAPTGKAAKRMQEVVKQTVKTLHSRFKIGLSKDNEFTKFDESNDFGGTAFFFDEGAMITIDLLYQVLTKIDITNSRIFLFGDFNQLPPIGKGLPFKNLLRFMPCVFLNVSKRAADGSAITKNSDYVNERSSSSNWVDLESGDDFILCECKSDQINSIVYELCAYYLGKLPFDREGRLLSLLGLDSMPVAYNLTEDDIQVVSPLAKETYSWGTISLNKLLQPLFNPVRTYESSFVYQLFENGSKSKYSKGDRVIHTDKNLYSMQWYKKVNDTTYEKVYGFGICNGEVGKVVGFYESTDISLLSEQGLPPMDFEYPSNLRDDSTWYGSDKWFVVVKYFDYISGEDFYILYRALLNDQIHSNEGVVFKGDDLSKLNLFYAGTTHKLQGSQAKVIICPLDSVSFSGFITREMIYTMFTRGEELVFAIGSVGNSPSSMLTRARKDIASKNTNTIGEIIVN